MRCTRFLLAFTLAIVVLPLSETTPAFGGAGPKKVIPAEPAYAPGEVLVKFKGVQFPLEAAAARFRDPESLLRSVLPYEGFSVLEDIRGGPMRVSPQTGIVRVKLSGGISVQQAIDRLQASGVVQFAEPNYRIHLVPPVVPPQVIGPGSVRPAANPTDPSFAMQWALNNTGQVVGGVTGTAGADIKALAAWKTRTDASTTVVAILGTGIDYTHPDLKANIWKNPGETCGDAKDNDANGYVDDCYGINAYLNTGDPMDDNGVGTHMAGIVGAAGNNGVGIAGVAWKASLMALKFLDEDGWGWSADAVQCIDYALKMRDKYSYRMVILSPVMGGWYTKAIYDSISTAQTKGVLVVSGAGDANQSVDQWPLYPGSYDLPNIVSAAASESSDYRMGMSLGAETADLEAPGQNIYSTWLTNTYKLQSSSNASAAFVAGAAALAWSQNPTFNWKQIKALILNGAEDGLHVNYWYGNTMTEGRLNLANMLTAALAKTPAIFSVMPQVTKVGETVTINGVGFGTTAGTVSYLGGYVFPSTSIVSWADEKIVLTIPAASTPGQFRLAVKTTNGTSRGAIVRIRGTGSDQWIYPTWMGATLMTHEEAAFAQVGTDLWIISGRSNYDQTPSVERFSLLSMRGQVNPDWEIPLPVRRAGAAAIGTKIYVAGGYNDDTQKWQSALQIFDTVTGTWTRGHNLPAPLDEPAVVSASGKLYVMGGRSPNNTGLKTNYMYDPASNTWTTKAPLILKTAFAIPVVPPTAVAGAGKIWLMSGYTESGGTFSLNQNVLEYDTAGNYWGIRDDIPLVGQHGAGGGIALGNKVFCMYGNGDWGAGEWISPASGTWVRNITYPNYFGNYTVMLGKVGNYVYFLSGSRARNVYRFSAP